MRASAIRPCRWESSEYGIAETWFPSLLAGYELNHKICDEIFKGFDSRVSRGGLNTPTPNSELSTP